MNDNIDPITSLELSRRHLFMALQAIHSYDGKVSHQAIKVDIDVLVQVTEDFHLASSAVNSILKRVAKNNSLLR